MSRLWAWFGWKVGVRGPRGDCTRGFRITHLAEIESLLSVKVHSLVTEGEDVVLVWELRPHRRERLDLRVEERP